MMLTNNQKEIALKNIQKGLFAGATLKEKMAKGTLDDKSKNQLLSLMEYYLIDVQHELDYDSHLKKEQESRFEGIRKANERIQELEKQLASKNSLDGFLEQFELVQDKIREWWKKEGFVYVEEIELASYGVKVKFGFQLSMRKSFFSKDPEGDRAEHVRYKESLKAMGFEFIEGDLTPVYQNDLVSSINNKKLLERLITKRFPSFVCQHISCLDNSSVNVILSVEGYIEDFDDVKMLDGE